ncbi:MAG: peptidyl-tRNA hydrolase, family [Thermodesulfobacteriota bacterium]|nr:peptidyl-tRNA hydrolase, family [Thermodesulfobacteriota bacterium]
MPDKRVCLIAGLGNPGDTYARTRHNSGFMVVDALSDEFSIPVEKKKFEAVYGRGTINGIDVVLAKPMAYMNRSGPPVQNLSNYFRVLHKDLLIVYDDIDLAFGRLKINVKGGDGGHKGIRSIIDSFGGDDIPRLRIGVGRSGSGISVSDYVLGRFSDKEKEDLDRVIKMAGDAAVTILCDGITEGMNRFNDKRIINESGKA